MYMISPRRILSLAHELRAVYTFSWRRSNASCNPTAFMSVFCNAEVMYMCMSRKCPMTPSCSDCSISNCESNLTNHSNDFWSRFIQKKSTCWKKKKDIDFFTCTLYSNFALAQQRTRWKSFQSKSAIEAKM